MVGYDWIVIIVYVQGDGNVFVKIPYLTFELPFFLTASLILPLNNENIDRLFKLLSKTILEIFF